MVHVDDADDSDDIEDQDIAPRREKHPRSDTPVTEHEVSQAIAKSIDSL